MIAGRCIRLAAALLAAPAAHALFVLERQDVGLLLNGIAFVVTLLAFWVLPALGFAVEIAVIAYSGGMVTYYAATVVWAMALLRTV